jgi:hypothetical protein
MRVAPIATEESPMALAHAVLSGVVGAVTLTALHQLTRTMTARAPRMDVVGMRALSRASHSIGWTPPAADRLYVATLALDLVSNSAYYALAGAETTRTWRRGALLGMAAGIGALVLPRHLGLGDPPQSEHALNKALTVLVYLAGGLAAAGTAHYLATTSRTR